MIEQLKTIREALERLSCLGNGSHYGNSDGNRIAQEVLPLARQLESLVGEQEPVHLDHIACIDGGELRYMTGRKAPRYDCELYAMPDGKRAAKLYAAPVAQQQEPKFWYRPVGDDGLYEGPVHNNSIGGKMLRDEKPGEWVPLFEGAAPVAQQYEAGDMASASAQGFRDGVASVAQQAAPGSTAEYEEWVSDGRPVAQQPYEAHLLSLLARIHRDGGHYTAEHGIEKSVVDADLKVAHLFAAQEAQQPQPRPDFADEWTGYLKDGETPFERFLRERKDMQSVLKLYQRVLEENERLKAQQPQADTPQATTIAEAARDVGKWLNERPNRPIDLRHVAMLVAHAMQPQAEAVPELTDSQIMASVGRNAGGPDTSISENRPLGQQWTEICALVRHIIRERYCGAAPQQAEAVPAGFKLLKDTTHDERSWPEDYSHENGCYSNTCINCLRNFTGYKRRAVCKVCDAAIAQQKGGEV